MLQIGRIQKLKIIKTVDFGVYLGDDKEKVLLPKLKVPKDAGIGDEISVFVYRDSEDRLIATTDEPKLQVGEYAALSVLEVSRIGAFLDCGLERDLFLPFSEQERKVREGDEVLVRMYVDKSNRLCASMKGLYHMLSTSSPYRPGDNVSGRVYEFSDNFGTFVAVDDKYSAMLPRHEKIKDLRIGDVITARVTMVKEDGKLDISVRESAYKQIEEDADMLMQLIESYGGVLPFNEKSPADLILRETGLSKNAFKRALGRLYKERKIDLKKF